MAVQTGLKPRVIVGIESGRRVAPGTVQPLVLSSERVRREPMSGLGKCRSAPARDRVTGAAFTAIGPMNELAFVPVLVAIQAFLMSQRLLEVHVLMTLQASHLDMFAIQRKLRGAVVEAVRTSHSLPGIGAVATFASRRESTAVGILMAPGT